MIKRFIDLNRSFAPIPKDREFTEDDYDLSISFGLLETKKWRDLLQLRRVIILAEAGAGKTKEIEKSYSSRYGRKGIGRSKNMNPTPDDVKRVNQRNAETRLRRLINCNFEKNDIHLVLTYKKDERPKPEEAKKILANFIRRIKRRYKKLGIEFKYIHVTEFGKKNGAIHRLDTSPTIPTTKTSIPSVIALFPSSII